MKRRHLVNDFAAVSLPTTDLGWHQDWVVEHANNRAHFAFVAMHGDQACPDERYLLLWERTGLALAGEVQDAMVGIEEACFIERAKLTSIETYLRRLHHLLQTSPKGGTA